MLKTDILVTVRERLIFDVTEITEIKMLKHFLMAVDIEKAFDALDHNFLISTLKKYGFGKNYG